MKHQRLTDWRENLTRSEYTARPARLRIVRAWPVGATDPLDPQGPATPWRLDGVDFNDDGFVVAYTWQASFFATHAEAVAGIDDFLLDLPPQD